jgi:transcriptional regulator with XRE-family HTH domain
MKSRSRAQRLGETVRDARLAKGLSIRRLAREGGVTHSFVAKLEAGRFNSVSADNLAALAKPLDLPATDLFALSGYKVPEELPTFGPYLRVRYGEDLPDRAIESLNELFDALRAKYSNSLIQDSDDQASRPAVSGEAS